MSLIPGTRIGPYEVKAKLGEGGMGAVYRAQDSRLDREVAIKVLPAVLSKDEDRLRRFEQEARATSALNHPNILTVYDIGEHDGSPFIVAELLNGEELRRRVENGPIPVRKALDYARQIVAGLSAAHEKGIVHRDLKPENIFITADDRVKILDFGLAKLAEAAEVGGGHGETRISAGHTSIGVVLGTPAYMSPEQVRGGASDQRSDIFSFGVILYEMLTGRKPFHGDSVVELMNAILKEDVPEFDEDSRIPPALDKIMRRCLDKRPAHRFHSAHDLGFALEALSTPTSSSSSSSVGRSTAIDRPETGEPALAAPKRKNYRELAAWMIALGMTIAVGALGAFLALAPPQGSTDEPLVFAPMMPWRDGELSSPAVSPDGARIAFIQRQPGGDVIAVRSLGSPQSQPIKGTTGVRSGSLFWSPDGRSLGFFAGGKLRTVETTTGKIEELADVASGSGGAWGPDGTILFNPDERAPIFRVSSSGGPATPVTSLEDKIAQAHRWPQFLPDGRHFIYVAWGGTIVRRPIQLASLDGGPSKTIFEADSAAVVAGNHYIFVQDAPPRLMAQAFNPSTFEVEGRPRPLLDEDNVDFNWYTGEPMLSASSRLLVYSTGNRAMAMPTWFSRTGQVLSEIAGGTAVYYDPAISADGTTLAIEVYDPDRGTSDLMTVDVTRGASSRLTSAPGFEAGATWSPDGRRIAFSSDEKDTGATLRVKSATGAGDEEVLLKRHAYPSDWSRDSRYLLFTVDGGATGRDVWVYDFEQRAARALISSPFNDSGAVFSPDGKWVAYVAEDLRQPQIYIQSFSDPGVKIAVTEGGGRQPAWSKTGKELFYLAPDTTLTSVELKITGATLASNSIGEPTALFRTNIDPARAFRNHYAFTPDGQRVMLLSPIVNPKASPLVGVLNWSKALGK